MPRIAVVSLILAVAAALFGFIWIPGERAAFVARCGFFLFYVAALLGLLLAPVEKPSEGGDEPD